jgi:hypothetical protein
MSPSTVMRLNFARQLARGRLSENQVEPSVGCQNASMVACGAMSAGSYRAFADAGEPHRGAAQLNRWYFLPAYRSHDRFHISAEIGCGSAV